MNRCPSSTDNCWGCASITAYGERTPAGTGLRNFHFLLHITGILLAAMPGIGILILSSLRAAMAAAPWGKPVRHDGAPAGD